MKKSMVIAAAIMLSAFSMPSCNNDGDEQVSTVNNTEQISFSATASVSCGDNGLSKVALAEDGKSLLFSVSEKASVDFLDESAELLQTVSFTGTNTSEAATTTFTATVDASLLSAAASVTATIPASAVESGSMVIPSEQNPEANGFDANAFIATGSATDLSNIVVTFTPKVALLKVVTKADYDYITIEGTGICGNEDSKSTSTVTVTPEGGIKANTPYYVAVWPGTYTDGLTVKDNSGNTLKASFGKGATLSAGKYYTVNVRENVLVTMDQLGFGKSSSYKSAIRIVFDYTDKVDESILKWESSKTGNDDVTLYSKDNVYYFLSDKNICMTGSLEYMFDVHRSLVSIKFNNFNTAEVTSMSYMFSSTNVLSDLDVTGFNTAKVTDMSGMFGACLALKSIDLSNFNTSNVTTMNNMFSNESSMETLDLTSFNTSKVTDMSSMFCYNSTPKITKIYISDNFVTSQVTSSSLMFYNFSSIEGDQGTTYDSNHVDKTYAHLDGGTTNPGYFSVKPATED